MAADAWTVTDGGALLAAAALGALGAVALPTAALAQAGKGDIRIAIIASKTGPLEAYAKQTIVGFNLGLKYATGGTMAVAGRKLVVIEKDDVKEEEEANMVLLCASEKCLRVSSSALFNGRF